MFTLFPLDPFEKALWNTWTSEEEKPKQSVQQLKVDIEDKGDSFELVADLPGFSKEDVHIDVDDEILSVEAKHQECQELKKKNYVYKERTESRFVRSFDISGIEASKIQGSFKDGILTLQMPKKVLEEPKKRTLELSDGLAD